MKRNYIIALCILFFMTLHFTYAQTQRVVPISGIPLQKIIDGKVDTILYDQIYQAIAADAPNRLTNKNVVYELKRGHVYISVSSVNPTDYNLILRAEAGTGPLPLVLHAKTSTGASNTIINAQMNCTLENIEFDSQHSDHSLGNRTLTFSGIGYRAIIKGCRISNDRGSLLTSLANNQKIYVIDCVAGNSGHFISIGGNGRLIDLRSASTVDTLIIQNTTSYNLTDRFIRNMGPVINYVKIDHTTVYNVQGYHGFIQLGKTKKAEITNNIFGNPMTYGERTGKLFTGEQTQPDKRFAVITHDSLSAKLTTASITIRNNNIFFDQKIADYLNQVPAVGPDTVKYPREVSSYLSQIIGSNTSSAYFKEILQFKKASPSEKLLEFTTYYYTHPKAAVYPNNFSDLFPVEWDVSYATTSKSYTAADQGYPVGDLNAWPALKARWAQGLLPTKGKLINGETVEGLGINQNYPNPFSGETTIYYSLTQAQNVEVSIFNTLGQKAKTLVNAQLPEGDYNVTWDGTDNAGNSVSKGLYLLQISGANGRIVKKMIKN